MLDICKRLFNDFEKESVRYCHWKSNEHLEDGLEGKTDMDIYVMPKDKEKAEKNLTKNSYIKFVPQKNSRYPMVDEWIGFDRETGKLVHVHLHYRVITGTKFCKEYVFPVDDLLISSRYRDEKTGVYLASPNLEILILYCRIVLKSKNKKRLRVNEDYLREIAYLKNRIDERILKNYCMECIAKHEWEEAFRLISKEKLNSKEWFSFYCICNKWLGNYKSMSSIKAKGRHLYFYITGVLCTICNKILKLNFITKKTMPYGGITFCFSGTVETGKSTIITDIRKWLNWKIEAKIFHLGSKVKSYKELKKADRYSRRGGIALVDGFRMVQFSNSYDDLEKVIKKSHKLRPNVIFELTFPSEKSIEGQPDHVSGEMSPKSQITSKLPFDNLKIQKIDATQSYESNLLKIKRTMWKEILVTYSRHLCKA